MKLLVKRDPNGMIPAEGRVELDSDVPKILKQPRLVHQNYIRLGERHDDDLVVATENDYKEIDEHFESTIITPDFFCLLPAVWSGYRSVLVSNGNGGLYRLKGVSFNPEKPEIINHEDGDWEVFGGQPLFCARYEKQMSDKFNQVLVNEGIAPVMTCKGFWHYDKKARGRKLSASVIEVQGDTRLDEMMFIIESYLAYRTDTFEKGKTKVNREGYNLFDRVSNLYYKLGVSAGLLKKLMDKNNQTWSADNDRSNAHMGNIVLYNDKGTIKTGFVDFDASCDTNDFSKSKIKAMQKKEYGTIIKSVNAGPISLRQIMPGFMKEKENYICFTQLREKFIKGFETGYAKEIKTSLNLYPIVFGVDFTEFAKIVMILRSNMGLVPQPIRRQTEEIIYKSGGLNDLIYGYGSNGYFEKGKEERYSIKKKDKGLMKIINNSSKFGGLDDDNYILRKNRDYQEYINSI